MNSTFDRFKSPKKLFKLTAVVLLFLLFCIIATIEFKFIVFDFQHEYREGAIISLAEKTPFKNWFSYDQGPENLYVYGFAFPLVSKLLPIQNKLVAGRIVSFASILISGLLMLWLGFESKKIDFNGALILLVTGIIYLVNGLYASNGAFPSALGQLFYLIAILSPLVGKSNKYLMSAAVFGILAFYTKPYYALSLPIAAICIFFFDSKKRAISLFNITTPLFLASVLLIDWYWPGYFTRSFFSHIGYSVPHSNEHLINQLTHFAQREAFILMALVIILHKVLMDTSFNWNLKNFEAPFLVVKESKIFYITLAVFISVSFFVLSMGSHVGASGAYYLYHLSFPFIILIVVYKYFRSQKIYRHFLLALIIGRLVFMGIDFDSNNKLEEIKNQNEQLVEFLDSFNEILNTGDLASILYKDDKTIYDNGQSEYFIDAKNFVLDDYENIIHLNSSYMKGIMDKIKRSEFDLIIINPQFGPYKLSMDHINENYRIIGQIYIKSYYTSFRHNVWVEREKYPSVEIPELLR